MRAKNTLALAALSCVLAACSSTDSGSTAMSRSGENYSNTAGSGQSSTSSDTGSMSGSSGTSGTSGASSTSGSGSISSAGSSDMGSTGTSSSDGRTSTANNASSMDGSQSGITIASATVLSIEPVARGMDLGSGETQAGSSGTAGSTTGSAVAGSAGNMMYRVTLRLDDGSTRAIMQNSAPSYQTGDRVKMVNGLVQKY